MVKGDLVVIPNGFSKIRGAQYETESGTTRVRIERQRRMHKFESGYEDRGRPVPLFTGSERDARAVYAVLREWFEDE